MNKKNFLFSSVGDNTNFHELYVNNNMNYDIYVIYYGDNDEQFNKYKKKVNFIEKRKGSKFQNFNYFYKKYPEIINKYDFFFIIDDDILIETKNINKMFEIAKKYNLWICGPSFLPIESNMISHAITVNIPELLLTYTNFVEVNTPLFNKYALKNLMEYYDDCLIGWGIDYLYIWANGIDEKNKFAIIHDITCINPKPEYKILKNRNYERELSLIDKWEKRNKIWEKYSEKIKCPSKFTLRVYGYLKK